MTDPDTFDAEMKEAAQQFRQQREQRERMPGCVALFLGIVTLGFFTALFFLAPAFVYKEARELYHFYTCEQATMGKVLSCEKHGASSCIVTFAYTPEGGSEQRLEQESRQPRLYPPGTIVKLRYKEGHAFIDNGREDKIRNLIPIVFLPVFWFIAYSLFAALGVGLIKSLLKRRARKGRPDAP